MGEAIAVPVPVPIPNSQSPIKPTTPPEDNGEIEEEQPQEELTPEEAQEADQDADSQLPKPEQNPFNKPSIDAILQQEMNDDMWRLLRGGLPCLETSAVCLQQLQEKAIAQSPLLKEIDSRIAEANERIAQAKIANKRSISLSIMTPGLQYLLNTSGETVNGKKPGFFERLGGLFGGSVGIINDLLRVVGIPLFEGLTGGNSDTRSKSIQISDLQIKVAELQKSRAQLADTIREKVAESLIAFDEARTDYQTAQVIASRAIDQFKVFELRYVRGNSDTETYLLRLSSLDNQKAQAYRAWAKMRRSLFKIKLLVLSIKEAEI